MAEFRKELVKHSAKCGDTFFLQSCRKQLLQGYGCPVIVPLEGYILPAAVFGTYVPSLPLSPVFDLPCRLCGPADLFIVLPRLLMLCLSQATEEIQHLGVCLTHFGTSSRCPLRFQVHSPRGRRQLPRAIKGQIGPFT